MLSRTLRYALLPALAVAVLPAVALAQPPTIGSTYTFQDPVFVGTVFCDTLAQVRDIVNADEPNAIYALYRLTENAVHEPVCMAIAPTGQVVNVTPVGNMVREGEHFHAWAVETKIGTYTAFGLYLERFEYASI